jgi:hypothetical protein
MAALDGATRRSWSLEERKRIVDEALAARAQLRRLRVGMD